MPDPKQVRAMFARIAGRYDLLNRVLSAGIDRRWRRRAIDLAEEQAGKLEGRTVVDACCGTGDLSLLFAKRGARVVGVDFTSEMLGLARRGRPLERGLYAQGDALRLPLEPGVADVVATAFGIRNVADRSACLREMARVLRPGGLVLVLEFGLPKSRVLGALYRFYFTRVLPRVGGWIAGDREAYRYLPDTVFDWPDAETFQGEMLAAGLVDCGHRSLSGGIAFLHWGRRQP
ncbi:MAG: class I SAM-dependent methyltransferase [Planctomycetota bacterium]|nr:class I SAM-dependent methyltransferase [Planctomycetota bacterium]